MGDKKPDGIKHVRPGHPEDLLSEPMRKHLERGAQWIIDDYKLKGIPLDPDHPPAHIRVLKAMRHLVGEMFDFSPEEKEEEKT